MELPREFLFGIFRACLLSRYERNTDIALIAKITGPSINEPYLRNQYIGFLSSR